MHTMYMLVLALALATPAMATESFMGRVVGIADGDTISVMRDGVAVKVRLYGVDAPEKAQAYGAQARQATAALAFGQTVMVVIIKPHDLYGRIIGQVVLPDGQDLSQVLACQGLAWWYRALAPHASDIALCEQTAQRDHLGLWQDANPTPPWLWRKSHH